MFTDGWYLMPVAAFVADPTPVLALLEQLKDDPVAYVRRSVANNLNDIAKDHPELVLATLERWQQGASDERRWVIRHALRTLVKQGHPEALRLLGAGAPEVELVELKLTPAALRIGERLTIAVALRSTAATAQQLGEHAGPCGASGSRGRAGRGPQRPTCATVCCYPPLPRSSTRSDVP